MAGLYPSTHEEIQKYKEEMKRKYEEQQKESKLYHARLNDLLCESTQPLQKSQPQEMPVKTKPLPTQAAASSLDRLLGSLDDLVSEEEKQEKERKRLYEESKKVNPHMTMQTTFKNCYY
jgi:phytoene dehydrogenase-like protein